MWVIATYDQRKESPMNTDLSDGWFLELCWPGSKLFHQDCSEYNWIEIMDKPGRFIKEFYLFNDLCEAHSKNLIKSG